MEMLVWYHSMLSATTPNARLQNKSDEAGISEWLFYIVIVKQKQACSNLDCVLFLKIFSHVYHAFAGMGSAVPEAHFQAIC